MAKRIGTNRKKLKLSARKAAVAKGKKTALVIIIVIFVLSVCIIGWIGVQRSYREIKKVVINNKFFSLKNISIKGNQRLSHRQLIQLTGIEAGVSLPAINTKNIVKNLEKNLWVKNVRVLKFYPGTLQIRIKERKVCALINVGKFYLVDEEGILLPLDRFQLPPIPLVSGFVPQQDGSMLRLQHGDAKRLINVLRQIKLSQTNLFNRITQIDFKKDGSLRLTVASSMSTIVIDESRVEQCLMYLSSLLKELEIQKEKQYKCIDLRFKRLAFVS